jgi:WD40 repeat protein
VLFGVAACISEITAVKAQAPRTDIYGDPLPAGAIARLGTIRYRNPHADFFDLSPDSTRLALHTASPQNRLDVCDPLTGRVVFTISADKGPVKNYGFSPDNRFLAVEQEERIHLLDKATGAHCLTLEGGFTGEHGRFAGDGKTFAIWGGDGPVWLWDTDTGRLLRKLDVKPAHPFPGINISRDLRVVAHSPDGEKIEVWDLRTGRLKRTLPALKHSLNGLALAPKGNIVVATGADFRILQVYDVATGRKSDVDLGRGIHPLGMRFSPDGRYLAALEQGEPPAVIQEEPPVVYVWDVLTGKPVGAFLGGSGKKFGYGMGDFSFSQDSRKLAIIDGYRIFLYDIGTRARIYAWTAFGNPFYSRIVFARDGKLMAVRDGKTSIRLFDIANGSELQRPAGHADEVRFLIFSADGKKLFSSGMDASIRVWDFDTGRQLRNLSIPQNDYSEIHVTADGSAVLSFDKSGDSKVRLWNVPAGQERFSFLQRDVPIEIGNEGAAIAVSPQGAVAAATRMVQGRPLQVYDPRTGKSVLGVDYDLVTALAFSPDGRILAVLRKTNRLPDKEGTLDFIDASTGKLISTIDTADPWAHALFFSPDGRLLGRLDSEYIQFWEVATRQVAYARRHRPLGISEPGITRDGRIMTVEDSRDWHFWLRDGDSEARLLPIPEDDKYLRTCAFSPDGKKLVTGSHTGQILVWDLEALSPKPVAPVLSEPELATLWSELGRADAARAYKINRSMVGSPVSTVAFLAKNLHPAVPDQTPSLVVALDAPSFAVRDSASKKLAELGLDAEPAIQAALERKPGLETRRRLEMLLDNIRKRPIPADQLRLKRAIAVLEHIGTAEALHLLEVLAKGSPNAVITQEAKTSAERLRGWRTASK